MKKLFVIIVLWLAAMPCSAHKEWVHQYIVQEAYRYLEKQVGEIPVLRTYAGIDFNGTNNPHWGPGNSPRPWELPLGLSVGVWREDLTDPVWGNTDGYTSLSHFWSADIGDDLNTQFDGLFTPNLNNAFDKARRYMFAGSRLNDVRILPASPWYSSGILIDGMYKANTHAGYKNCAAIDMTYNNLCDLIVNKTATVHNGFYYTYPNRTTHSSPIFNGQSYLGPTRARYIGFCILGHILHLLADGSVPAHTHADTHICGDYLLGLIGGNGDTYELAMGSNLTGDCDEPHTTFLAQNWNAATAAQQGGLLLEVFSMSDDDALRYLFYTTNQLANHFGTVDNNGNNNMPNGSSMLVSARYPILGSVGTSTVGWMNQTQSIIDYTGDELMNYAIRVSATLMYWMAIKTGITECPETLYQQSHTYYGVRTAEENASFKALSRITAGRNVHPNLSSSQGNVVVESGSLTYLAGEEISLKDGFIAKAGSSFHAKIENGCPLLATCVNNSNTLYEDNPTPTNHTLSNNVEAFAKKGDSPSMQALGDTIQKCTVYIPSDASVTQNGDSIILSNWLETIHIRKPNDTLSGDTTLVDGPIWILSDSLVIIQWVDSTIGDTIVLTYDYFSTILLDDSTSRVIIVKSDTSGTTRFTGNDFTPRIHSIYPNPNSDYIDLQVDGMGSAATVTIYSQMGVQLSETTVGSSEKLSRVSTSGLAPGMYMAVIKTAKGRTSKNFIVNR